MSMKPGVSTLKNWQALQWDVFYRIINKCEGMEIVQRSHNCPSCAGWRRSRVPKLSQSCIASTANGGGPCRHRLKMSLVCGTPHAVRIVLCILYIRANGGIFSIKSSLLDILIILFSSTNHSTKYSITSVDDYLLTRHFVKTQPGTHSIHLFQFRGKTSIRLLNDYSR